MFRRHDGIFPFSKRTWGKDTDYNSIPVRINILILKLFDILKLKYSDIKMFLN